MVLSLTLHPTRSLHGAFMSFPSAKKCQIIILIIDARTLSTNSNKIKTKKTSYISTVGRQSLFVFVCMLKSVRVCLCVCVCLILSLPFQRHDVVMFSGKTNQQKPIKNCSTSPWRQKWGFWFLCIKWVHFIFPNLPDEYSIGKVDG